MENFKHKLGDVVSSDPTREGNQFLGRVVGYIVYESGDRGYILPCADYGSRGVVRHFLGENEICAVPTVIVKSATDQTSA
jgi:hypothetical protein